MNDVEMIEQGYANFARGDLDAIREVMSPDVVWHVPGRSSMAGDYRGRDAVIGYFLELFERSGGTVRAELKECSELSPGRVVALVHLSADMPGGRIDQDFVQVFQRENGVTTEVWGYSADQYGLDETDTQTPAGIVRRGYAAFSAGDMDTLQELFSPDIEWVEPGRHALAGTYHGVDAVLGFFGRLVERSSGTFRVEPIGVAEIAPGTVTTQARIVADLPGGSIDTTSMHAFTVADGRVTRFASYPADQYALDAAMGGSITLPDARTPEQPAPVTT
ncbi:MAG TPA: nuclear transport factor 2 family protein [Mycobacteriales bacterium]|nr:nuclear transport factor 2 family protein [Mycobacteriales bacterium]